MVRTRRQQTANDRPQLNKLNRPHHQGRMGQEVEISLSLGLFEFWYLVPWRDSGLRVWHNWARWWGGGVGGEDRTG